MRWRGRRESSNIEDVRGGGANQNQDRGGGGVAVWLAGGGGFGTIIILVVLFFLLRSCGINPLDMLTGGGGNLVPQQDQITRTTPMPRTDSGANQSSSNDEMKQFVGVILAETENVWNGIFQQEGQRYPEPKLVMFYDSIRSACG